MSRLNEGKDAPKAYKVTVTACWLVLAFGSPALADETLHRYEGDVFPEDAGWISDPCVGVCTPSIENGHLVLRWATAGLRVGYGLEIGREPETPPPPTLWVEWRFRSNHAWGHVFGGCDAGILVDYKDVRELVDIYGDTAISFDGGTIVTGLDIEAFHTYRFESLDGINFTYAVDGSVFMVRQDTGGDLFHSVQMRGGNNCASDNIPNKINEWDMVRYGTIGFGERVVSADPPSGLLDPVQHADLDRFAITFDQANFIYIDEITVEVTSGLAPVITQTWRRENDEPDTLEVVLDTALNTNAITRFIISDGVSTSVVEYSYNGGDFGACCQADGSCTSQTETGCGLIPDATFLGVGSACAGDATESNTDSACNLGPCCFSDGSCAEDFRGACIATPDAKFHAGGNCQGDNNGNNIDERCEVPIPTTSEWGLIILTLALLIVGALIIRGRAAQNI